MRKLGEVPPERTGLLLLLRSRGLAFWPAILFILVGLSLNKWSLAWLVSNDGQIDSTSRIAVVVFVQLASFAVGAWLIIGKLVPPVFKILSIIAMPFLLLATILGVYGSVASVAGAYQDYKYSDYATWTLPSFTCGAADELCNVTEASGLGERRYGKGASFADINGDGWDDLFITDADPRLTPASAVTSETDYGVVFPEATSALVCRVEYLNDLTEVPRPEGDTGYSNSCGVSKFYLNNQDGAFQPVDVGVNPEDLLATWAASFADYDNDGDPDVLFVNGGYEGRAFLTLYENRMKDNGRFVSVTSAMGIDVVNTEPSPWWGSSWADYDNDGFLDVVVNRVRGRPVLFHNNAGRSFTEVGESMGIDIDFSRGLDGKNLVWIDHDVDGDPDLYVAGIFDHAFYENLDGKKFANITSTVFDTPFPPNQFSPPDFPFVFSAAAEDFNQDGVDDLYLGRWHEADLVLINTGRGQFRQTRFGLDELVTRHRDFSQPYENTMGLGVGDLFGDGFPDVFLGSGNPQRADLDILFCNEPPGQFARCTELLTSHAGGPYRTRGHGAVFGDVNRDGRTDLFVNLGGHARWDMAYDRDSRETGALYVRQPIQPASTATINLEGTASNRDAIGARVRVQGSEIHYYTVRSMQGFQSQNSKALVVTLGGATSGEVEVYWPSGSITKRTVNVGERRHIVE